MNRNLFWLTDDQWTLPELPRLSLPRSHHYLVGLVRLDPNSVEGYFSILKRGLYGLYQHVSEAHQKRYLSEFDFRYSYRIKTGFDDQARMFKALAGIVGKRLTYRSTGGGRTEAPPF